MGHGWGEQAWSIGREKKGKEEGEREKKDEPGWACEKEKRRLESGLGRMHG